MPAHHEITAAAGGNHGIVSLIYATAADRATHTSPTGAHWSTVAASDLPLYLVAHQADDDSTWILTGNDAGTLTWGQL